MVVRSIRLKPPQPTALGDYALDHVVVELGEDETELDFRFELGSGLGIYWALPAARDDRLRLAHVDGAAYHVDEPELIADPWTCDLALAFEGELGVLGNGRTLRAVRVEVTSRPPAYACELVTRRAEADELVTRFAWRAADPSLALGPVVSGHRAVVAPPAFSPDGRRFVAGDERGALIVHERHGTSWTEAARAKAPAEVRGVAWSPDGARIAAHDRLGVRLCDPADLTEQAAALHVGDGPIAFGGNGAWLAALGRGSLQVLAVPSLVRRSIELVSSGEALAVDPAGGIAVVVDGGATEETAMGAVTAREAATLEVFEVASGTRVTIAPGGPVRGLAHDRARGHLVANLFSRAVSTWTSSGDLVRTFEPYEVPVRALAVTERWLVMIPDRPHGEATLDLWSYDSLERRASVAIPGGLPPDWVVASPDGRTLLTRELPVRGEFGIRVWRVDDIVSS